MAWYLVNSDDLRRISGGGVDPGFGVQGPRPPVDPGYGMPAPPPHPWFPGNVGGPGIDNSLPGGPPVHPWLPGMGRPDRPDNSLPWAPVRPGWGGGPSIDNSLPGHIPGIEPPPTKPIDPEAPLTGYIVVFVPGHGYKVIAVPVEPPEPAQPK